MTAAVALGITLLGVAAARDHFPGFLVIVAVVGLGGGLVGVILTYVWPQAAGPSALQPRYEQKPPYRHPQSAEDWAIVEHRLGIFNPQGNPAIYGVRVTLLNMTQPRHVMNGMDPFIPYLVPPQSGGDAAAGLKVAPGTEELWLLGYTSQASEGRMFAGGFAVPDQHWRGLPWQVDSDERWRLTYRINSEVGHPVEISLVLYVDNGALRCELQG